MTHLVKVHMRGDGNCLFRCFSYFIEQNESLYHTFRENVVDYIVENWDEYKAILEGNTEIYPISIHNPEEYKEYMTIDKTFGTEIELQGFAHKYSTCVQVYLNIQNIPTYIYNESRTNPILRVLYSAPENSWDQGHYDILELTQTPQPKTTCPPRILKRTPNIVTSQKCKVPKKRQRVTQVHTRMPVSTIRSHAPIQKSVKKNCFLSDYGDMTYTCRHCSAVYWPQESTKNICCRDGKVKLPPLSKYDENLKKLLLNCPQYREAIRYYNNSFCFATFNANVIRPKQPGIFNLKIQGQVCHTTPNSILTPANKPPMCGQIYIYDDQDAMEERLKKHKKIREKHLKILTTVLNNNPYAKKYKHLFNQTKNQKISSYKLLFERKHNKDKRRYNVPLTAECALLVTGCKGNLPENIDLCVYPKHLPADTPPITYMNFLSHHIDPMRFPLLFPNGDLGWSTAKPNSSQEENNSGTKQNDTAVEYYAYRLAYRPKLAFDPILKSGRLTQEYIINSYARVEQNRLNFLRHNQKQLRIESYQGLYDHMSKLASNNPENYRNSEKLGSIYHLPSTYIGSPRYMHQHYQDAMAIVRRIGRPDLFITMTCNPNWPEIQRVLKAFPPGTSPNDIAPIIVRLFRAKLRALIAFICNKKIFGKVIAYVYTIEHQGRGLPHAHIMFTLDPADKLNTPESIDRVISAEIPRNDKILSCLVKRHMLHGPHTAQSPCVSDDDQRCSKNFPKDFCNETRFETNGYPIYRRRNNISEGHSYNKTINGLEVKVDNSMVVPYNATLLKKFGCHINVEYCASIEGMKYIFAYLHKGHDRAYLNLQKTDKDGQEIFDEIAQYVDARYIGPMEAAWRLLQFPICERSHAVVRLAVHTENQQKLVYEEDAEEKALLNPGTTLTAWFTLNKNDPTARKYKYIEIPEYYTYNQTTKTWSKRRKIRRTIGRIVTVSPKDVERFHLKLILSRVRGIKSFEELRTHNGKLYPSYYATAVAMGLVENDDQIFEMFQEACDVMMPKQLREFFAWFLITENVQGDELWFRYKKYFGEDFENHADDNALFKIKNILEAEDKTCAHFNLPEPCLDNVLKDESSQISESHSIYKEMITTLNLQQRTIFDEITSGPQNLFFIDGPGGSGKTYLYTLLIHYYLSLGKSVLSMAWTGIAALLLPGGMTIHRTFRLPRNFANKESCNITTDVDKKKIREADIIFIDEGSMLPKKVLEILDVTLRDLCNCTEPFGHKKVIMGGDFRQILPVIKYGSRQSIVEETIKFSPLWEQFKVLKLSVNIRSINAAYAEFLLEIGNGRLETLNLKKWQVQDICKQIYSDIGNNRDILSRVILTTHNKGVNELNEKVLSYLPETEKTFFSIDFARYKGCDAGDTEIELNYDIEYLNSLEIPGLPVHALKLKINAIVMLIRNLSISDGLCNGTRLKIRRLFTLNIEAEIITGVKKGRIVFIPRILLDTGEDSSLPFILYRRQFPITLAFAMTINKSQGQSFDQVGIFINRPLFSHGQLYVALSRCRNPDKLYVEFSNFSSHQLENIVWSEVLSDEK